MSLASTITAAVLGVFGLILTTGLIALIVSPLTKAIKARRKSSGIQKYSQKLATVDVLIREHKFDQALQLLKKSVIVELFDEYPQVEFMQEHHQAVLSKFLSITEELGARAENIALLEQLFTERSELNILYVKVRDSFASIKGKRESKGKELPGWSKSEFEQKIKEIQVELAENTKALDVELNKFIAGLTPGTAQSITYH